MSRIGKKNIIIPENVHITLERNKVKVIGPKGELNFSFPKIVIIKQKDGQLTVNIGQTKKKTRSVWGTTRTIINNMVLGVTQGFSKQLEINGIGFKSQIKDNKLILNLGFSHIVEFPFPPGINIKCENNLITIEGIDKYLVGETAARIREIKKPEPYKGKGIKYLDEVIRRKAGKVVKSAG